MLQLGLSLTEIDESPAVRLDWLLQIDSVYARAAKDRMDAAKNG